MNFLSKPRHKQTSDASEKTQAHCVRGEEVFDEMKAMERTIVNLKNLVNDLINFMWLDSQEHVINPCAINLVDRVRSQVSFFSSFADEKGVSIEFNTDEKQVWISADRPALGKLLGTLMMNSLKYARTYMHIGLSVDGGKAMLRVVNDGAKLLPGCAEEIFKPYTQRHVESKTDSSGFIGIGLSLARSLARSHSGDLVLDESVDEGLCFVLTLPVIDPPEPKIAKMNDEMIAVRQKKRNRFLEHFENLVRDSLDADLSNEFLATEMGMSQSTLIRKIKKETGTTPGNYVNNRRMAEAARILKNNSDVSITEVCYAVGFTSVSYFAKCFKAAFGVTPREYAKKAAGK